MDKAMEAGANTNAYLGRKKMEDVANKIAEQTKITYDSSTDLATVQAPSWVVQKVMGDSLKMQDIEAIYDRQIQEKQARIEQLKAHPFANTLAQIAASMAANDPNPYTRGLGQAASKLNPTRSELEGQQAGLLKERAGLGERDVARDTQLLEHYEREGARVSERQTRHEEFLTRDKEAQARIEETRSRDKATAADREARLEENKRHDKQLEQEARDRLAERKTAKGAVDSSKVANTINKLDSQIRGYDSDIKGLQKEIESAYKDIETKKEAIETKYFTPAAIRRTVAISTRNRLPTDHRMSAAITFHLRRAEPTQARSPWRRPF